MAISNIRHDNSQESLDYWQSRVGKVKFGAIGHLAVIGSGVVIHQNEEVVKVASTEHVFERLFRVGRRAKIEHFFIEINGQDCNVIRAERVVPSVALGESVVIATVSKPRGVVVDTVGLNATISNVDICVPGFNGFGLDFIDELGEHYVNFRPEELSVSLGSIELVDYHDGFGEHTASTFDGKSGSAIIQNGKCVGVHVGFFEEDRRNGFHIFRPEDLVTIRNVLMH
eukprot:TRINITY_DN774029_c0_g1_i1.p1 TRINITY_DN774029_c0_g1~~TRINITY_DN774029_c0_g1_i1.p1  ORF type:complete len:260 (-),score=39.59 TRINITY_DN774029_c0_g1_i1:168-848(-)